MLVQDSEQQTVYATGTLTQVPIYVTGLIKIENAKIAVLDSDLGSVETQKKYVETSQMFGNDFVCCVYITY